MSSNGRTLAPHRPELVTDGPAPSRPRWLEMVMSPDHKDVGRIYIGAALSFLVLGIVSFLLMRLQLAVPENNLIEPVTFNRLLSVGSATLVVLFGLPIAFGLYTYVVPLQIGARSLAFPRLASLSLWLYVFGGALLYVVLRLHAAGGRASTPGPRSRTPSSSRTTASTSGSPRSA